MATCASPTPARPPGRRAIARGWPPAQWVPHDLRRGLEDSAATQEGEGRLLSMIQTQAVAELTWQKRLWLSGLCHHSGKACVANKAREVLAQGDLRGLLTWQLQDSVTLLDTFYMSWHKARGQWNFFDDNFAT